MKAKLLPPSFVKCVSRTDRKKLGIKTKEEAIAAGEAKSERELQGQIVNLLRLRGIEVLWHRTDKRSAATVGWPDLTFSVKVVDRLVLSKDEHGQWTFIYPCVWEIKLPTGKLSEEQAAMRDKLVANGWNYRVIRSVDDALLELKKYGSRVT